MEVCITGGSGFIGKRLTAALLARGDQVRSLTRKSAGVTGAPQGLSFHPGDLTDPQVALGGFLAGARVLFHCAGEINDTAWMRPLHVDGTARLLAAARQQFAAGGQPLHWVQLSSVGAYGPDRRPDRRQLRIVDEETAPAPVGEYEVTKTEADQLVLDAAREGYITCTLLRPANVFGADMPNQSLRSMIAFIRKGLFFYIGPDDVVATYIHVDDVVETLLACGFDPRTRGHVFNLSNDCAYGDLVNAIADAAGVRRPRLRLNETLVRRIVALASPFLRLPLTPERIDAMRVRTRYPVTKLQSVLGLAPRREVCDAIRELL